MPSPSRKIPATIPTALVSPKLSVILGPWHDSEIYLNAGEGYHSNDARGVTATVNTIRVGQSIAFCASIGRQWAGAGKGLQRLVSVPRPSRIEIHPGNLVPCIRPRNWYSAAMRAPRNERCKHPLRYRVGQFLHSLQLADPGCRFFVFSWHVMTQAQLNQARAILQIRHMDFIFPMRWTYDQRGRNLEFTAIPLPPFACAISAM